MCSVVVFLLTLLLNCWNCTWACLTKQKIVVKWLQWRGISSIRCWSFELLRLTVQTWCENNEGDLMTDLWRRRLRLLHLTGTVVKSSSSIFSSFPQPVSHFLNLTKDGENLVHLDRTVWRALYIVCSFNFDIVVPFFMQFSLLFCYPALYLHISFVFLAAPFRLLRELYAVILYELWFMQYNCLCQSVYRSSSTCFWFCSCHDIENNARACLTVTVENNNSA